MEFLDLIVNVSASTLRLATPLILVAMAGLTVIDVAGHTYTVNLSAAGFGDLNLDTENGQAVPDLSGGGTVVVTSGDEQISGRF